MEDKELVNNLMKLPSTEKPVAYGLANILYRIKFYTVRFCWNVKHILKCEERYMTEKTLMRYCHKCRRYTITDKRLVKAYKRGGLRGLLDEKKKLIDVQRSAEVGEPR